MRTLEEALSYLEGVEGGEEYIQAIKSELSKKNNEAQNLRKRAKTSEESQSKTANRIATIAEKLGLDFDSDDLEAVLDGHIGTINELKAAAAKAASNANAQNDPESAKLAADLAKATADLTALQKQAEKEKKRGDEFETKYTAEHNRRIDSMKSQAVIGALSESNAVKPAQLARILLPNVRIEESTETLLFVNDKGEEVPLSDGVKDWLGANPEFVLAEQKPGTGAGGGNKNIKTITRAQLADPAFYRQHYEEINSGAMQVAE